MILEGMSIEEIADIVRKDYDNELANGYASCFGMRQKYGRYVIKNLKADQYHYFGSHEKITKNLNKYIFHFYSNGKKEYYRTGIIRSFWLEYLLSDGLHAVKVNPHNTKEVTFYNPHFFDRYRERYLEPQFDISDWNKRDIIEDYMLHNEFSMGQYQNNPKYPDGIFATSSSGVCLGRIINDDIWEYKTFITFEMLKNEQIDVMNEEVAIKDQVKALIEKYKFSTEEYEFLKEKYADK